MTGKKTGGRVTGTPNKTTAEMRAMIHEAFKGIDLVSDLKALTPDKRIELLIKLLPYVCSRYKEKTDNTEDELFNFW